MAPPKKYPKSLRKKGALRTVARCYAERAASQPKEYWNDAVAVEWGAMERYEVLQQLGKGKYGEVFEGVDLEAASGGRGGGGGGSGGDDGGRCVVKIMRPVKEQRLKREIKILRHVRGGPNIISLSDLVRDPDTKTPCFVFEMVDAVPLRELQGLVSDLDVRHYMLQLLRALDFTHARGIMHRDVKPANVLIDHSRRQLKLIDWGLADFYFPGKEYPVRVVSASFLFFSSARIGPECIGFGVSGSKQGGLLTDTSTHQHQHPGANLKQPPHPFKQHQQQTTPSLLLPPPLTNQATRFYKGPELLLDIRDYDYSLDIWGVGCMLAAFLFKRQVFFRGEDEFDQLVRIAKVLGSEELYRYAEKYGVEVDPALVQAVGYRPRQPWRKFVTDDNRHLVTPEALDLLGRLLTYDHQARPTAAEAIAHPYFDPVRGGGGGGGGGGDGDSGMAAAAGGSA